jgi:hypothetical protein
MRASYDTRVDGDYIAQGHGIALVCLQGESANVLKTGLSPQVRNHYSIVNTSDEHET